MKEYGFSSSLQDTSSKLDYSLNPLQNQVYRKQLRKKLKKPLHCLNGPYKNDAKFNSDNSAIFVAKNAFCYYSNQYKNEKDQQGGYEKMLDRKKWLQRVTHLDLGLPNLKYDLDDYATKYSATGQCHPFQNIHKLVFLY